MSINAEFANQVEIFAADSADKFEFGVKAIGDQIFDGGGKKRDGLGKVLQIEINPRRPPRFSLMGGVWTADKQSEALWDWSITEMTLVSKPFSTRE